MIPYLPHSPPKAAADAIPFFLLSLFSLCGGPPDKPSRAEIKQEIKIRTFFLPPLFLRLLRSRLRLRLLDRLLVRDRRVRFRCRSLLSRDLDLDRERDRERVRERERERDNDFESDRARPRSQDLDLVRDLDCRL